MSEFAALALYPTWAIAVLVGVTAMRLGRSRGWGLVALCLCLAAWVSGLVLFESEHSVAIAERVLPCGMLLAGGFVHAGADVVGQKSRSALISAYAFGLAVTLLGAIAPRLLYGAGARGTGPLFVPIAFLASLGTATVLTWLARSTLVAHGVERRRRGAIALGCALGAIAGGGAIGLRVLGIVTSVRFAAPLLLVAVVLAAYAVLSGEHGRARRVLLQALVYALLTAALSAIGLTLFFRLLPTLSPGGGESLAWLAFVIFFAALPLDGVRVLVVEFLGRKLFQRPIGVRDLTEEVDRTETRADHAERLAEIGRITSAVAHEIRNPLGIIAAHAKLLERAGADPESVAALRHEVDRAKRFLDDMLRYSQPRPLDVRDIVLLPAIELAVSGVRQLMAAPSLKITVAAPPDVTVEMDRSALNDVVTVLAQNAVIASIDRSDAVIEIRARVDGAYVEVIVQDNGPGVPEQIEARLFQPFVTGRGRDALHPGTGLGLAIAARWVERHGGTIRHERPAAGGARFVVRFARGGRLHGG